MRIEKAEAGKAKLQEQIKKLEAEVAAMDAGTAEALKIRQEEHEEYLKASKDFKDSAAAVAKAIDVLNDYYSSAAFVQVHDMFLELCIFCTRGPCSCISLRMV